MSRLYPYFANYFVLPFYDLMRGTSRFRYGQVLEKTQWLSKKELEVLQTKQLRGLLKYAYVNVPYYRRVFKERSLKPSDIKNFDDLKKFPVLTKADIRKNSEHMVSRSYPKSQLIRYRSGGSGNPIRFYITKEKLSWEVAAEYRAYNWANYRLGDRCFMFWGSPIDRSKSQTVIGNLTKFLERISIADTYLMSESKMRKFVYSLEKFNPEIIKGYTTSLVMIAKYFLENKIDYIHPKSVITAAETLFDSDRKIIEEAFACPVFDYYGSREVGAIAAECEEHNGYHIAAENVLCEFVNEGEYVSPGEKGTIVVTNLRNFGMPFIRYKIGDVGIPSEEKCSCGRGLPLLSSVEGRLSDFLAVYDRENDCNVPVGPVYPFFEIAAMHSPIESYQVIQERVDEILIKIVKGEGYSQKDSDLLIEKVKQLLGDTVEVKIDFVDEIPPLASGKRSRIISKVTSFY